MKNRCTMCDKEHSSVYDWGKCADCKQKEEIWVFILGIFFVICFFGLLFTIRVVWANIVFDDWRCALSECRIIKE